MSLQIRRGTNAQRQTIIPQEGELIYTIDTNAIWVGDGATPGGVLVASGNSVYGNAQVQAFLAVNTGNIRGNNITATGSISSATSIGAAQLGISGAAVVGSILTNNYRWANNEPVFGGSGFYGNSDVANYLPVYGGNIALNNANSNSITNSGNITTGNILATGFFFANGAPFSSYSNADVSAYLNGGFTSNIIPQGNATQSLGNATNQWKDLWLSGNTLYLNSIALTANANRYLVWDGNTVATINNDGNLVVPGSLSVGNGIAANSALFSGNVGIGGNLNVLGNLTYENVQELTVVDPLIFVGDNNVSNLVDLGLVGEYTPSNVTIYTGIVYDHVTNEWRLFNNVTTRPNVTVDFGNSVDTAASLFLGNLTAAGNITAAHLTANIANSTGLANVAYSGLYSALVGSPTNVSFFTNDAGYITASTANVVSVNGQSGVVVLDIPTATSNLINDSGFITSANANVVSVNGESGVVVLDIPTTTSNLINDSGFITSANANVISVNGQTGEVGLFIPSVGNFSFANTTMTTLLDNTVATIKTTHASVNIQVVPTVGLPLNWYFDPTGNLVLPTNSSVINYANGDPYGSSYGDANVKTLLASGNVQDIVITGNLTVGANLNVLNVNEYVGATGNISFTGNLLPATNGNTYSFGLPSIPWSNIYSVYLHGDGSNITGLQGNYGDSNVEALLSSGNVANITISGDLTVGANLNVVNVNEYVGATGNVSFTGNLIPGTNGNIYTMGLPSIPWSNVYANSIDTGNLTVPGTITVTTGIVGSGASPAPTLSGFSSLSTVGAQGNITASGNLVATANVVGTYFIGDGSQLTNLPTPIRVTGSWTLTPGVNNVSFTVPISNTYSMWVKGNIPNGIVSWNATVTVSNPNVPAVGAQYGWYYVDGNALVLNAIPDQIIGTSGTIISTPSSYAPATSNVFKFTITNNSGTNQVVEWGYNRI